MLIFVLIEGRERRLYRIAHPLASSFIFLLFCLPLNRTLAYRLSFPLSLYTIFHQLIQTLSNDTCHHLVIFIIWPIQHTVSFMDDLFDIPYCFVLLLYEFMRLVQCFLDASVAVPAVDLRVVYFLSTFSTLFICYLNRYAYLCNARKGRKGAITSSRAALRMSHGLSWL